MPTLDEEFAQYQSQSLLVLGADPSLRGQCFMVFDFVLHDVYGLPYFYAPGAIDIWETPGVLANSFDLIPYDPAMHIQKGDIVVYGTGVGSQFGHVDIAFQDGTGSNYVGIDSNWGGNLTLHQVNHNDKYNQFILGVLRFKGENMKPVSQQVPDDTTAQLLFQQLYGGNPTREDLDFIEKFTIEGYLRWVAGDVNHQTIMAKGLAPDEVASLVPYSGPQLYVSKET